MIYSVPAKFSCHPNNFWMSRAIIIKVESKYSIVGIQLPCASEKKNSLFYCKLITFEEYIFFLILTISIIWLRRENKKVNVIPSSAILLKLVFYNYFYYNIFYQVILPSNLRKKLAIKEVERKWLQILIIIKIYI